MKKHILISAFTIMFGACTTIPGTSEFEPPPARIPGLKSQIPINSLEIKAPAWVLKGGGAFTGDEEDRSFYGVGSATGIKNYSLARIIADDRARNDLAKMIAFDTRSLSKDYLSHTTAGDFTATSEEQHAETAIKTLTASTVSGIVISDHWEHPYRGEIFSLAKLDLEWFKRNVDQYKELSKGIREAIKESADKLHRELEEELLKKRKEHFEKITSSKEKLFEEQLMTLKKEKELLDREKNQLKEEKGFVEKQTNFLTQIENHMARPDFRNPSIEEMSFIEPPEKTDFEKKWQRKEPLTSNSKWWKSVFY